MRFESLDQVTDSFRERQAGLLYPLSEFYEEAGLSLPQVEEIDASRLPEPYKSLLAHENDMTPTLERFHHESIRLRMLKHHHRGDVFSRQVVLLLIGNQKVVEFGAIRIYLRSFSPKAQRLIVEGQRPLGNILASERIAHTSHPRAYVRVTADEIIGQALQAERSQSLYERRNVLLNSEQETLAEILEILPVASQV